MVDEQPVKSDPDGPPSYDETGAAPPPGFTSDKKGDNDDDELAPTLSASSSRSSKAYSSITAQPSILALEANPPRYAAFTIHSWNKLRFVNFPHSVLEAVDHVAKAFYLNGVGWEFEVGIWTLKTNAKACKFRPVVRGSKRSYGIRGGEAMTETVLTIFSHLDRRECGKIPPSGHHHPSLSIRIQATEHDVRQLVHVPRQRLVLFQTHRSGPSPSSPIGTASAQ